MSRFVALSFLILSFCLVACQKRSHWEFVEWTGEGSPPETPQGVDSKSTSQSYSIKNQSIQLQLQKQSIHGIEVEDAYYKKVIVDGKPEFISYQWLDKFPARLRADAAMMKTYRKTVLAKIQKKNPVFKTMDLYQNPQLVMQIEEIPKLLWKVIYSVNEGHLVAFYFDKKLNLIRQIRQGSAFVDAKAFLYPDGPLKSSLQEVVLKNLLGNDTLTSPAIRISTRASLIAKAENNQFIFPVSDTRFEQVQVFYYLSQSLKWFHEQFKFILPFTLEAETAMGFPDKTNTAFYFQGKIRLGEGDGSVYAQIPLDPSIVIHESVHAVIDQVAHLPYEDQGGSLNEAFADYFAASQLNNPNMAEASYKPANFKRSLENERSRQEMNGGLYHDSEIVSGLLWALRKELGATVADRLAWQTLTYLTPQSGMDQFFIQLNKSTQQLSTEEKIKAEAVFKKRGWQ